MRISVQAMIIIFLFVYGFDTEPLGFLCTCRTTDIKLT